MTQSEFETHKVNEIAKLKAWEAERLEKSSTWAAKLGAWAKEQGMK